MSSKILFSKPITCRTAYVPLGYHQICDEAFLSAKYEKNNPFGWAIIRFILALKLLANRKKFDIIITGRYGDMFALFQAIIPFGSRPHILLDMEWKNYPSHNIKGEIKKYIKRIMLRKVIGTSVFCEQEIEDYSETYGIARSKFFFLPFCIDGENAIEAMGGDYIFTGGIEDRDYKTLYRACKDLNIPIVVCASAGSISREYISANMMLTGRVSGKRYQDLIAKSRLVVLSLKRNQLRFPGVITYVMGMFFGKCVIVNESVGAKSYIRNGYNGFLVKEESPESLREAILKAYYDDSVTERVGFCAKEYANKYLSYAVYYKILSEIICGHNHG